MSKPAILIVEDEAIVAEDLSGIVQHLGYDVAGTIASGEEAVAFVRQRRPALVLMDIRLAGKMDGIAAAMEIHRECDLPVVFLTAHADESTVSRAQQAEAFGYILKPFDVRDLRIQIEMAIFKHAAGQRLRASEAALRESEERFHSMFERHLAVQLVIEPETGIIVNANAAAGRFYGYSCEQLCTLRIQDINQLQPEEVAEKRQRATREQCNYFVFPHRLASGEVRWVEVYSTPVESGGRLLLYSIIHDITERKQAQEQISTLNRELESRVLDRTNELQETVTALETEIQNRHRLERGILEISEREQCRLGQDLHDGLGQELSGIAMLGVVLTKKLRAQNNPLANDADKLATYVSRALDSTRRLAKGLYPIELERSGLRLALQELADQTRSLTRISCEVRHNGAEPKLDKPTEIHIYRIIQECIGNAVKHAMPKQIIIETHTGDGMHIFSVTDDGKGFAVPTGSFGMGLHLMHYRARLIRAELTIEQPETLGCRITCRLRGADPIGGIHSSQLNLSENKSERRCDLI